MQKQFRRIMCPRCEFELSIVPAWIRLAISYSGSRFSCQNCHSHWVLKQPFALVFLDIAILIGPMAVAAGLFFSSLDTTVWNMFVSLLGMSAVILIRVCILSFAELSEIEI